jgi:adenosylmethionine-8-amino-7-oxononanoate aminotransferase
MADAFAGPQGGNSYFAHGHTFAGNPLACAVGIAVIDEIVQKNLSDRAQRLGEYLSAKLSGLTKLGVIREVRGKGVLRGVELSYPNLGIALKKTALQNGIILRIDPGWFAVSPPLIASEADIDEMCDLIEKSLKDALELLKACPGLEKS